MDNNNFTKYVASTLLVAMALEITKQSVKKICQATNKGDVEITDNMYNTIVSSKLNDAIEKGVKND